MLKLTTTCLLVFAPVAAHAACDPWTALLAPDFEPVAASVGTINSLVVLDTGLPLSEGERVVIVSGLDDEFSCIVRIGDQPDHSVDYGEVLADLLVPDTESAADWSGQWQAGIEQFITITETGNRLGIFGEATWGMADPERVERGGVNMGEFSADTKAKGRRLAFSVDYDGVTLPFDPEADSCSVELWLVGEFLAARDNMRCGGMNVTFNGFYRRSDA